MTQLNSSFPTGRAHSPKVHKDDGYCIEQIIYISMMQSTEIGLACIVEIAIGCNWIALRINHEFVPT